MAEVVLPAWIGHGGNWPSMEQAHVEYCHAGDRRRMGSRLDIVQKASTDRPVSSEAILVGIGHVLALPDRVALDD